MVFDDEDHNIIQRYPISFIGLPFIPKVISDRADMIIKDGKHTEAEGRVENILRELEEWIEKKGGIKSLLSIHEIEMLVHDGYTLKDLNL